MCEFCKIIAGDMDAEIVYEDGENLAFFPLSPATIGHTLVVPKFHASDIYEIKAEAYASLSLATWSAAHAIRRALRPVGLNVINSAGQVATQTVFHIHVHLVPRWPSDGMDLRWPDPSESPKFDATMIGQLIRNEVSRP
ncbi:HIT family protein [Streptomyces chartreusis]